MSDYNLGTARGVIEIEYKGDGARQAREDIDQTRKSSEKAAPSLDNYANKAGVAGAVIAGGFALAVNSAANFEQRMSAVQAVSGATSSEMDLLSEKALQLGKDTAFSATESASAMEELVKAGLTVEDVINGAADATVALAAAGELDMATSATIASNAMNAFGLGAEDMIGVVDQLAGAANASAIDVTDIGESMKYVGGIAKTAGADFGDMNTAIGLLGNYGIKGSQAGTTLRSVLQRLNPVTKKQKDAMQELGLMTEDGANKFYDAEGNLKSMSDVAGLLQTSMKGLTKQQQQQALTTLFGAEAVSGAAILAENGAEGFDKMADSIGKVSAADVAATRMDNFKGSLEETLGALETVGITVGTLLLPHVRNFIDAVGDMLNMFLELPAGVQLGIVAFVGILGATLLAFAAFVKIVNFLKAVRLAFIAVRAAAIPAWLAALGPIALVIIAIAAVVAIIVLLWKKNETFRRIVTKVWEAVKSAVKSTVDWFKGVPGMFSAALDAVQGAFSAVLDWIKSHWRILISIVLGPLGVIIALVTKFWPQITAAFQAGIDFIKGIWEAFWGTFGGIITAVFGLVVALLQLWWTVVKGVFLLAMNAIKAVFLAGWNAIVGTLQAVWGVITAVVRAGINFVLGIVRRVWNTIRAVTSAVWNGIRAVISAVWGVIGGTVMGAVNRVKSVVTGAWNAVRSATARVWNGLKGIVSSAVGAVMGVVSGIKDKVLGALSGAATWLYDKGKEIIQGLLNGIEAMVGKVTDKIKSVTGIISNHLPGSPVKEGPLKVLNNGYAGRKIVEMVVDGVDTMAAPLEGAMGQLVQFPMPNSAPSFGNLPLPADLAPRGPSRGGDAAGAGGGRSRLVEGTLKLDRSGRAFIQGVAEDTYDGNARFQSTYERMG